MVALTAVVLLVIVIATIIVVVIIVVAMPVPTGEAHCTAARETNMPPRPRNGGIESDEALYAPQPLVLHELVDLSQNGYYTCTQDSIV